MMNLVNRYVNMYFLVSYRETEYNNNTLKCKKEILTYLADLLSNELKLYKYKKWILNKTIGK